MLQNVASIQIQKVATFNSDRKIINLIPNKSFKFRVECCNYVKLYERYVFNNFLLIDATDRSKISGDQKRLFFAVNLYPLSFFANTPFKIIQLLSHYKKCFGLFSSIFSYFIMNWAKGPAPPVTGRYI